jgi:hypothetical protein
LLCEYALRLSALGRAVKLRSWRSNAKGAWAARLLVVTTRAAMGDFLSAGRSSAVRW